MRCLPSPSSVRFSCCMLLGMALLLAVGCGDNRSTQKDIQQPPWPETNAPIALQSLGDDLMAFQATMGRLPTSLKMLDQSGMCTGGPYSTLAYAYHPTGIGVLRDGWRILVADDRIRQAGSLWCIVRAPVRVSGLPSVRIVQVPMDEARAAATAASGGG